MTPDWSPDGRALVFTSDRDANLELYSVRVDGAGLRRLTTTPTHESNPQWVAAGPVNWLAVRRTVTGWLGFVVPSLRPTDAISTLAPLAPRDESPSGDAWLPAPGEDVFPRATPPPAPAAPPGAVPQPTPTPGLRPVPNCAPGSFWC
jgi:hypothetical protein